MIGRADYEARRAARVARLEARAAKLRAEGASRIQSAKRIADGIPFGQPILVGHHSERRARRDADRIHSGFDKGYGLLKEADRAERSAAAAESNDAISSDDPQAVERLKEKLAGLEARRVEIKKANAAKRKTGGEIFAWELPNLGAQIRSVEKRIAELTARAERVTPAPESYGAIIVREENNRVQVIFPGKPAAATIEALKRYGFKWAPSEKAWQRMASNGAWVWAREIVKPLTENKSTEA